MALIPLLAQSAQPAVAAIPSPYPRPGIYDFACGVVFDDFTSEKIAGQYVLNDSDAASHEIRFAPSEGKFPLAGKTFAVRWDLYQSTVGGIQEAGLWTHISLPGTIPIIGEEFTFTLFQDGRGPGHPGTVVGALKGAAVCRRSSEPVES